MISPEEEARANLYGMLARLFCAPPDAALLAALASADELEADEGKLAEAWRGLVAAAAEADEASVREEYESQFVGTGKAPVSLYASAYLIRYSSETPLAQLRTELVALGLARRSNVNEPEDHIAALCEVMRHLIAEQERGLGEQRPFFERWIWPAAEPLCGAIQKAEGTRFYRSVAALLLAVCMIEHSAFEML